ncbi:hypothetical protein NPIL_77451 [Nephila pilipes]|uniref:Uncharacterized protein n=1 Tax=Nephila pilipes TaxID=299642 RepID=A0A8X6N1X4_NEPPI|nr:hypothetical protein NPIL_77451 [Nephila pilipes]
MDIALEDKFQYLVQAIVIGFRAREVVESYPSIGANYVKAVESLKPCFEQEDLLVEIFVRKLIKLNILTLLDRTLFQSHRCTTNLSQIRLLETLKCYY